MLNNGIWDLVSDLLKPDHFASDVNGKVFDEISKQLSAGKACDVVTVGTELRSVVDMSVLSEMSQYVPSTANARRYARAIVDCFKARQLASAGAKITEMATNPTSSIDERLEGAQAILMKLASSSTQVDDWMSIEQSMKVPAFRFAGLAEAKQSDGYVVRHRVQSAAQFVRCTPETHSLKAGRKSVNVQDAVFLPVLRLHERQSGKLPFVAIKPCGLALLPVAQIHHTGLSLGYGSLHGCTNQIASFMHGCAP